MGQSGSPAEHHTFAHPCAFFSASISSTMHCSVRAQLAALGTQHQVLVCMLDQLMSRSYNTPSTGDCSAQAKLAALDTQYQAKIMGEVERYQELAREKELLTERWDQQNSLLVESHERVVQELTQEFEQKLQVRACPKTVQQKLQGLLGSVPRRNLRLTKQKLQVGCCQLRHAHQQWGGNRGFGTAVTLGVVQG